MNTRIVDKTEQFVLSDGKWNFDPSTVVTLKAEKGDAETAAFYQTITDWVIANKGQEYAPIFSGKSNNEYYMVALLIRIILISARRSGENKMLPLMATCRMPILLS